jgi:ATP-dependent DNA helicase RecG
VASNTAKKSLTLATPLQYLKGIGPARAAALQRKGLTTLSDALFYFPRRYEDRRRICEPKDLVSLSEGTQVTVYARMERQREIPLRGKKTLFELVAMGEQGDLLTLTWFHTYKGLQEKMKVGSWAIFQGALKKYRGAPQIVHPDVEILPGKPQSKFLEHPSSLHWGRVVPIYARSEKLSQKFIRETIANCLAVGLPVADELIPLSIRQKYQFPTIQETLQEMHFPKEVPNFEVETTEQLPAAVRRLIFEEFFKFQLVLLMDRTGLKPEPSIAIAPKGKLAQTLRQNIPYQLTKAQERCIGEIVVDLQKSKAMNRIVQGDVGSGKTFVALFSAAEVLENGWQVALMAPTEILAEQHFQNAQKLFANTGIVPALLTGSKTKKEKDELYQKIRSGEISLVIGTHALIQEAVEWQRLAFVIVDEQHRFGVRQRTALKEKAPAGTFPHVLTMTATPIPRSLALTIFGELAVSTIDELPPGRQEILTKILRGSERQRLYNLLQKEVAAGRQGYIVYPLVTDSEKEGMERIRSVETEFARLKEGPLFGLKLAMVHGQMKAEERNTIMRAFKNREYDILISTTVIEVGVDVPNASVMAIENAERFGLSQLHQLRGRVGRGSEKSYCVLITDSPPPGVRPAEAHDGEEGVEEESPWVRLKVLEEHRSGFVIAEEDLRLRGPGDFFGTKQSGSPTFRLANLSRDAGLLELARKEALAIHEQDPQLKNQENETLGIWFHRALAEAATTLKSG